MTDIAAARRGLCAEPSVGPSWESLAIAMLVAGRTESGLRAARRAVAIDATRGRSLNVLGVALRRQEAIGRTLHAYRASIVVNPGTAETLNNYGMLLKDLGRMTAAALAITRAHVIAPHEAAILANLLVHLPRMDGIAPERLFAAARRYDEQFVRPGLAGIAWPDLAPDPRRRLRVGYIGSLMASRHGLYWQYSHLMIDRDRSAFDATFYTDQAPDPVVAGELAAANVTCRRTGGLDDRTVVEMIRDDRIDILMTPVTHVGGGRTAVIAAKPAPIQTDMGSITCSGISAIDLRLTDLALHPADTTELFVERLVRMPQFYVFRPSIRGPLPPIVPSAAPAIGGVTFVAPNRIDKTSEGALAAWARIMRALPTSRLLIRVAPGRDADVAAWPRHVLAEHGIAAQRISTFQRHATLDDYLRCIGQADIMLDSFPFGGCNTLVDSMLMGVPPVALAGVRFAGRHAAGILPPVGLAGLVTTNVEDYVARAVALAQAPDELARLRADLRERVLASAICDTARHVRVMERIYRAAWRLWCAGR